MKKLLTLFIFFVTIGLYGCSEKDNPSKPFFEVSPETLTFTQTAQTQTIDILSNISLWTVVSSEPTWCKVLKSQGKTNGMIDIRVETNNDLSERSATITIAGDGKTISIDVKQAGLPDGTRAIDSMALIAFYNAAKPKSLVWDFTKSMNTWQGVHVNNGRVDSLSITFEKTAIPFYDNGTLSPELGKLLKLVKLELLTDGLTGSIPKEIGNLKNLKILKIATAAIAIGQGGLTGSIPAELGNLTNLDVFYLMNQKVTGGIPAALSGMINLTQLVFQGNENLGGTIPASIGSMTKLTDVILNYNNLTGSIPKEIGQLSQLIYLWLHENNLSGAIPNEIANLTKLNELFLYKNQLTALPANLTNMIGLQHLYAYDNLIEGTLPNTINNMSLMMEFVLHNNKLSGEIPSTFGQMTMLNLLSLSNNQFSGGIPTTFGPSSIQLRYILLQNNNLTGSISKNIASCPVLQVLQINGNSLSGTIPAEVLAKSYATKANFCPQNGVGFDNFPN